VTTTFTENVNMHIVIEPLTTTIIFGKPFYSKKDSFPKKYFLRHEHPP
jgi:hypothetical protein